MEILIQDMRVTNDSMKVNFATMTPIVLSSLLFSILLHQDMPCHMSHYFRLLCKSKRVGLGAA